MTDKDIRDSAMKQVMWKVGNAKNPVTEYIADAVTKRVVADEAEYAVEAIGTEALNIFEALNKQVPSKLKYEDECPKCTTYNEVFSKRRDTVGNDIVYCWHCGQAVQLEEEQ